MQREEPIDMQMQRVCAGFDDADTTDAKHSNGRSTRELL